MKSLTSKDLIVIAGIIVLGVVLFSATVIVRLVNTPVSTAPVITAETNNVQSYQVPEPQYNKCDADILANKIKNNCCEKSFETGLFDQDALVLCGAFVVMANNCHADDLRKGEKIMCFNDGKRFPENPCNDYMDLDKRKSCNVRRNQLIDKIVESM